MKKRGKKLELEWTDDEQEEIIWVSKSEIKRDAEELKKLGAKLVELTQTNLDKMTLDENLLDAVNLARRSVKEAKRRQLQFIGKLLRSATEDEIKNIRESLDKIANKHNKQQAMLHKLEQLRDELVIGDDDVLTYFYDKYPQADRQHLRNLVRAAKKEKEQNKAPKAYREIYRYLKALISED